jgi:hypothetical protein
MSLLQYLEFLKTATPSENESHYKQCIEKNKDWIAHHQLLRNTIERMVPESYKQR